MKPKSSYTYREYLNKNRANNQNGTGNQSTQKKVRFKGINQNINKKQIKTQKKTYPQIQKQPESLIYQKNKSYVFSQPKYQLFTIVKRILHNKIYQQIIDVIEKLNQSNHSQFHKSSKAKNLLQLRLKMRNNLKLVGRPLLWKWYFNTTAKGTRSMKDVADRLVLYTNINRITAFYRIARFRLGPKTEDKRIMSVVSIIFQIFKQQLVQKVLSYTFDILKQYLPQKSNKILVLNKSFEYHLERSQQQEENGKQLLKRSAVLFKIIRNMQLKRNKCLGIWLRKGKNPSNLDDTGKNQNNMELLETQKNKIKKRIFQKIICHKIDNIHTAFHKLFILPKKSIQFKEQASNIIIKRQNNYNYLPNNIKPLIRYFHSLTYNTHQNLLRGIKNVAQNSIRTEKCHNFSNSIQKRRDNNKKSLDSLQYQKRIQVSNHTISIKLEDEITQNFSIISRMKWRIKVLDEFLYTNQKGLSLYRFLPTHQVPKLKNSCTKIWKFMSKIYSKQLYTSFKRIFQTQKLSPNYSNTSLFLHKQKLTHIKNTSQHNSYISLKQAQKPYIKGGLNLILILDKHYLKTKNSAFYYLYQNMLSAKSRIAYEKKIEQNLELIGTRGQLMGEVCHYVQRESQLDQILRKRDKQLNNAQIQVQVLKIKINMMLLNKFTNIIDKIYFKKLINNYDQAFDAILNQANMNPVQTQNNYQIK